MSTSLVYRASFYIMMTVATTILCGDASDSRLDWLLPAVSGRRRARGLLDGGPGRAMGVPRDLANFLAVGTLRLALPGIQVRR